MKITLKQQFLSPEGQQFLMKLSNLDLEMIAFEIKQKCGWTGKQTKQAIAHYLMFLFLIYLYPNQTLVPTQEIDRVWHEHILNTLKYTRDCQTLFGRYIHHTPSYSFTDDVELWKANTAFGRTVRLFERHFGTGVLVNAKPADCIDHDPKKPA